MFSAYRRHSIVIALAVLAGFTSMAIRPQARAAVLPSIVGLTSGTGWHVVATYASTGASGLEFKYQEMRLRDASGAEVTLYLGATSVVQQMMHWNGELGYEGEGYLVLSRRVSNIRLHDGATAPISIVALQRLTDRELVEYGVVSPDGISARTSDDFWRTAWNTLRGTSGPYYLVRVTVAQRAGDQAAQFRATQLLSLVLSALRANARTSGL